MTAALLSDAHFFGLWLVGCLTLWLLAVLFAVSLGKSAARADTLADRMDAAHWDPVAAAEQVAREAVES